MSLLSFLVNEDNKVEFPDLGLAKKGLNCALLSPHQTKMGLQKVSQPKFKKINRLNIFFNNTSRKSSLYLIL